MNIHQATTSYERWIGHHTRIVKPDLRYKHEQMTASIFSFLRATFYRWVQVWPKVLPSVAAAPKLLGVGDLHIANFGTWRDAEGRLIWGINDFDEAFRMPYTMDLVRLVASAHLAIEDDHLGLRPRVASQAVIEGYRDALQAGGSPFVLGEQHTWLRKIAINRLRNPVTFWATLDSFRSFRGHVPSNMMSAVREMLPDHRLKYDRKHRVAGLGSLGRERIIFIAQWAGGKVVREAKALIPSACSWLENPDREVIRPADQIRYGAILDRAVRVPDPFFRPVGTWLIRRLAPDCSRIEMESLPGAKDEDRLLYAMGWETANIHLGNEKAIPKLKKDLRKRPANWLHKSAKEMVNIVERDWKDWRRAKYSN